MEKVAPMLGRMSSVFSASFASVFLLLYLAYPGKNVEPVGIPEPEPGPRDDPQTVKHSEPTKPKKPKPPKVVKNKFKVARVTAYTKNCKGCSGVTKDGTVADHRKSIVAADTRYHPIGTKVELLIPGSGRQVFTVRDTGGDIKGPNRFDILVSSKSEAKAWGVRKVEFRILD
jgi:3D (Asp-Asp-Asp) domain-containing protein